MRKELVEVECLIKALSPDQMKKEILMGEKVSSEGPEWPKELAEFERH